MVKETIVVAWFAILVAIVRVGLQDILVVDLRSDIDIGGALSVCHWHIFAAIDGETHFEFLGWLRVDGPYFAYVRGLADRVNIDPTFEDSLTQFARGNLELSLLNWLLVE